MNIVEPYAKLLNAGLLVGALSAIESAARISHRSEDAQTDDSTDRFIRAVVVQHGDWSVVEHVSASVEFYVDRGITHELVRHRLFSYTQESTRFVNYAKKMPPSFIYPNGDWNTAPLRERSVWDAAIVHAEESYKALLAAGWRAQEARSVLPNALGSKILITGNLRNWRHFLLMRTSKESHPQMRQVTIPLLAQFQQIVPILFDDIVPETRQASNIAHGR